MKDTRLFGTPEGDIFLCDKHRAQRIADGRPLAVPSTASAMMAGIVPWPKGDEPCVDCQERRP